MRSSSSRFLIVDFRLLISTEECSLNKEEGYEKYPEALFYTGTYSRGGGGQLIVGPVNCFKKGEKNKKIRDKGKRRKERERAKIYRHFYNFFCCCWEGGGCPVPAPGSKNMRLRLINPDILYHEEQIFYYLSK